MVKRFVMLSDSSIEPAAKKGTTVYSCSGYDYGCSNDDTRMTGVKHSSFTLDPEGGYPFFTHPDSGVLPWPKSEEE